MSRAGVALEAGIELVQMPAQTADHACSFAHQVLTVVDQ